MVYGHRTGQTHPQLLYWEKTEFSTLGRKVLTLKPDLARGKEKEPSRACEVVMEKMEPGCSLGGRVESWDKRGSEQIEGGSFSPGEQAAWRG